MKKALVFLVYLKAWNLDAGLLINFAATPLTVRRVYREKKT